MESSRGRALPRLRGFSIRLEPRLDVPRWLPYAVPVASLIVALILGMIPRMMQGINPLTGYRDMFLLAFGTNRKAEVKIAFIAHDVNQWAGAPRVTAALIECFCDDHEVSVFSHTIEGINTSKIKHHKIPAAPVTRTPSYLSFLICSTLYQVDKETIMQVVN